jgi:WD40 repeat protein
MPLVSAEIAVRCSYLACYAIHDNVHCILQQQSRLETRRERERESRETPLREPFTLWIVKVSSRELGLIPDKGREAFSSRLFHYRIEDNRAEMPHPSVVLATAGYDHTIRFWEATTGRCYRTLQYTDSVRSSNSPLFEQELKGAQIAKDLCSLHDLLKRNTTCFMFFLHRIFQEKLW